MQRGLRRALAVLKAELFADEEQRRLAAELVAARADGDAARAHVRDLAAQVEDAHERLSELQEAEASGRQVLEARHAAQLADATTAHQRALADMQTLHDRTHAQLAAALAENGALHMRAQEAEAAAEARRQDVAKAQQRLQAQEAEMEVRLAPR